uniref:Uncharacterized protein n=1 Tax=Populus davidiana TaxID=266767 RepID=A0A6M2EQ69_9ROSI
MKQNRNLMRTLTMQPNRNKDPNQYYHSLHRIYSLSDLHWNFCAGCLCSWCFSWLLFFCWFLFLNRSWCCLLLGLFFGLLSNCFCRSLLGSFFYCWSCNLFSLSFCWFFYNLLGFNLNCRFSFRFCSRGNSGCCFCWFFSYWRRGRWCSFCGCLLGLGHLRHLSLWNCWSSCNLNSSHLVKS